MILIQAKKLPFKNLRKPGKAKFACFISLEQLSGDTFRLEPGGCMLQAIHRQQWNKVCIAHNGDGPRSKQSDQIISDPTIIKIYIKI